MNIKTYVDLAVKLTEYFNAFTGKANKERNTTEEMDLIEGMSVILWKLSNEALDHWDYTIEKYQRVLEGQLFGCPSYLQDDEVKPKTCQDALNQLDKMGFILLKGEYFKVTNKTSKLLKHIIELKVYNKIGDMTPDKFFRSKRVA